MGAPTDEVQGRGGGEDSGVVWCTRCGAYAEQAPRALIKECRGYKSRAGKINIDWLSRGWHPRQIRRLSEPQLVRDQRGARKVTSPSRKRSKEEEGEERKERNREEESVERKRKREEQGNAGGSPREEEGVLDEASIGGPTTVRRQGGLVKPRTGSYHSLKRAREAEGRGSQEGGGEEELEERKRKREEDDRVEGAAREEDEVPGRAALVQRTPKRPADCLSCGIHVHNMPQYTKLHAHTYSIGTRKEEGAKKRSKFRFV